MAVVQSGTLKMHKAPVRLPPPKYRHSVIYRSDASSVAQPTPKHWMQIVILAGHAENADQQGWTTGQGPPITPQNSNQQLQTIIPNQGSRVTSLSYASSWRFTYERSRYSFFDPKFHTVFRKFLRNISLKMITWLTSETITTAHRIATYHRHSKIQTKMRLCQISNVSY